MTKRLRTGRFISTRSVNLCGKQSEALRSDLFQGRVDCCAFALCLAAVPSFPMMQGDPCIMHQHDRH
jgi:hypothetical protein